MREFSAIPTVLDAADRHARVRRRYTVDDDTTGVQVARHLACQSNVFGPYITAQSKLACIHRVSCTIMIMAQLAPLHSPSERKRYDPSA